MSDLSQPAPPPSARDAKAQLKGAKAYQKAQRPFWKKKRAWLLGLVALIAVIVVASNSGGGGGTTSTPVAGGASSAAPSTSASGPEQGSAEADVVVDDCAVDENGLGLITGHLTVANSQDENQSYLITVSANDASGNRVAELNAAANSIQAGQSAKVDAIGSATNASGPLTCVVANVTRTGLGA